VVVPLLIVVLLREEPDALWRDASIYSVNKALGCATLQMRQLLPPPSLAGRGGGGRRRGTCWLALEARRRHEAAFKEIPWSSPSAAFQRRQQFTAQLLNKMAVGRPLRALSLAHCWRQLFFFLQAGEPNRRIFESSVPAFIVSSSPSGSVPGDGAGGRDHKLSTVGGEGPDCVFIFSCRVLSIKIQGRVAVKVSARGLDVNCNPTASP
jgi:hypothetical protein